MMTTVSVRTNRFSCLLLRFTDGRLFRQPEGARSQQALPRARRGQHVLYRAAQVPHARPAGRSLPKSTDLHQQAGRETLSGAIAAACKRHLSWWSAERPQHRRFPMHCTTTHTHTLTHDIRTYTPHRLYGK